jgi:hypothetical protein
MNMPKQVRLIPHSAKGKKIDFSKMEGYQRGVYAPNCVVLLHGVSKAFSKGPFGKFALQVEEALGKREVPVIGFDAGSPVKSIWQLRDKGIEIADEDMFRETTGLTELWGAQKEYNFIFDKRDILGELKRIGISVSNVPFDFNDVPSKQEFNDVFLRAGYLPLFFSLWWSSTLTLGESAKLPPEKWSVRVRKSCTDKKGELVFYNFDDYSSAPVNDLLLPALMPASGFRIGGKDLILPTNIDSSIVVIGVGSGKEDIKAADVTAKGLHMEEMEKRGFFGEAVVKKVADALEQIFKLAYQQWKKTDEAFKSNDARKLPHDELRNVITDFFNNPDKAA